MFDTKTTKIKVGGMMCEHCSATVKRTLEELPDIKSVSVDLKKGEVTIKHKGAFPEDAVKETLSKNDYSFEGVLN